MTNPVAMRHIAREFTTVRLLRVVTVVFQIDVHAPLRNTPTHPLIGNLTP
jgi:hypothetical protein